MRLGARRRTVRGLSLLPHRRSKAGSLSTNPRAAGRSGKSRADTYRAPSCAREHRRTVAVRRHHGAATPPSPTRHFPLQPILRVAMWSIPHRQSGRCEVAASSGIEHSDSDIVSRSSPPLGAAQCGGRCSPLEGRSGAGFASRRGTVLPTPEAHRCASGRFVEAWTTAISGGGCV
jgi:hypothetical protein